METPDPDPPEETSLRDEAEARLRSRTPSSRDPPAEDEPERLIHELQVHQIELEMQNDELRRTKAELQAGLERYTDLFDFAPIGYFNLAEDGSILALNLAGARLLGMDRAELSGRRFSAMVSSADAGTLHACLERARAGGDREVCEVRLTRADQEPLFVHMEVAAVAGSRECRAAVLDVTERVRAEAERRLLIERLQGVLAEVKLLTGLLPICASCKKIRNQEGQWEEVHAYITSHSEAVFSHGVCPDCERTLYPELMDPE